jgi:hypothetical protein
MFYFNTNRGTEFQNDILSSFIFLTVITSCSTYFNAIKEALEPYFRC